MLSAMLLSRLRGIRHVVLDMDGTIYRGSELFPATVPFLELLSDRGIGYSFVTNNCSRARADYVDHLRAMGVPIGPHQLITSSDATIACLRRDRPGLRCLYVIGTDSLRAEFAGSGWRIADGREEPDAVVIGFDTALRYDDLCRASYWIREGKPFIATHPDAFCPTDAPAVLIDCGAVCACITAATGREPDAVPGKPDPRMLTPVLQRHGLTAAQLAVVGDRVYTDIAMARRAGALAVLVLTGDQTGRGAPDAPVPDAVFPGLAEFGAAIAAAGQD